MVCCSILAHHSHFGQCLLDQLSSTNEKEDAVGDRYRLSVSTSSIGHQVVHYFIPDPTEKSWNRAYSVTFSEIMEKIWEFLDPLLLANHENIGI